MCLWYLQCRVHVHTLDVNVVDVVDDVVDVVDDVDDVVDDVVDVDDNVVDDDVVDVCL